MTKDYPELDEVLSLADVHAEESREDGCRVLDRGGLLQLAKDIVRADRALRTPDAGGVPAELYVEARQCDTCNHIGINDSSDTEATCGWCGWSGPEPEEDHCPECGRYGSMGSTCPKCSGRYAFLADARLAAPTQATASPVGVAALQQAAIAWWLMHRPIEWGEEEHRANATINTNGDAEMALALAVAALGTSPAVPGQPSAMVPREVLQQTLDALLWLNLGQGKPVRMEPAIEAARAALSEQPDSAYRALSTDESRASEDGPKGGAA